MRQPHGVWVQVTSHVAGCRLKQMGYFKLDPVRVEPSYMANVFINIFWVRVLFLGARDWEEELTITSTAPSALKHWAKSPTPSSSPSSLSSRLLSPWGQPPPSWPPLKLHSTYCVLGTLGIELVLCETGMVIILVFRMETLRPEWGVKFLPKASGSYRGRTKSQVGTAHVLHR